MTRQRRTTVPSPAAEAGNNDFFPNSKKPRKKPIEFTGGMTVQPLKRWVNSSAVGNPFCFCSEHGNARQARGPRAVATHVVLFLDYPTFLCPKHKDEWVAIWEEHSSVEIIEEEE